MFEARDLLKIELLQKVLSNQSPSGGAGDDYGGDVELGT